MRTTAPDVISPGPRQPSRLLAAGNADATTVPSLTQYMAPHAPPVSGSSIRSPAHDSPHRASPRGLAVPGWPLGTSPRVSYYPGLQGPEQQPQKREQRPQQQAREEQYNYSSTLKLPPVSPGWPKLGTSHRFGYLGQSAAGTSADGPSGGGFSLPKWRAVARFGPGCSSPISAATCAPPTLAAGAYQSSALQQRPASSSAPVASQLGYGVAPPQAQLSGNMARGPASPTAASQSVQLTTTHVAAMQLSIPAYAPPLTALQASAQHQCSTSAPSAGLLLPESGQPQPGSMPATSAAAAAAPTGPPPANVYAEEASAWPDLPKIHARDARLTDVALLPSVQHIDHGWSSMAGRLGRKQYGYASIAPNGDCQAMAIAAAWKYATNPDLKLPSDADKIKAAGVGGGGEMRSRLTRALLTAPASSDIMRLAISTIHGMAGMLLRMDNKKSKEVGRCIMNMPRSNESERVARVHYFAQQFDIYARGAGETNGSLECIVLVRMHASTCRLMSALLLRPG